MTCNSIDIRKRSSALNRAEQYRTLAEDVRTRAAKEPRTLTIDIEIHDVTTGNFVDSDFNFIAHDQS